MSEIYRITVPEHCLYVVAESEEGALEVAYESIGKNLTESICNQNELSVDDVLDYIQSEEDLENLELEGNWDTICVPYGSDGADIAEILREKFESEDEDDNLDGEVFVRSSKMRERLLKMRKQIDKMLKGLEE